MIEEIEGVSSLSAKRKSSLEALQKTYLSLLADPIPFTGSVLGIKFAQSIVNSARAVAQAVHDNLLLNRLKMSRLEKEAEKWRLWQRLEKGKRPPCVWTQKVAVIRPCVIE